MLSAAKTFLGPALLGLAFFLSPGMALGKDFGANGIKFGTGRLHPFFDVGVNYDSAAIFMRKPDGEVAMVGDLVARVRPGVKFSLLTASTVVDGVAIADYFIFSGVGTAETRKASHLEIDVGVNAGINRDGAAEVQLSDHLSRSERTTNIVAGAAVISLLNDVRLATPIHPGGGALEVAPSATWTLERFEALMGPGPLCDAPDGTCDIRAMNYTNLNLGLGGRWRFLPKTAMLLATSLDLRNYETAARTALMLFNASGGLTGLLFPRVTLILSGGYGVDFGGSQAETLIGRIELGYSVSELTALHAGYVRSLAPIPVYGVYASDRIYANVHTTLTGRLSVDGAVAYDHFAFYSNSDRSDSLITGNITGEYRFLPWMSTSGGYAVNIRASNNPTSIANFLRHEIYLRVSLYY